jgi:hypothetical protein
LEFYKDLTERNEYNQRIDTLLEKSYLVKNRGELNLPQPFFSPEKHPQVIWSKKKPQKTNLLRL